MSVTMTQIAKEAGVSVSLVSRLLRNDDSLKVADDTKARILSVADRLGGTRSVPAVRRHQQKRCTHIMIPVSRDCNEMATRHLASSPLIRAFESVIQKRIDGRASIVFFDHNRRVDFFRDLIQAPDYCDGILMMGGVMNPELEALFQESDFPVVGNDSLDERYNFNTVCVNERVGIERSIAHLTTLGHRDIGYVGLLRARFPLFVSALVQHGLSYQPEKTVEVDLGDHNGDPENWFRATLPIISNWLADHHPPSAIYCHNDHIALAVIEALEEHGYTPGKDVSVIGYDNLEVRGARNPGSPCLTTIDNPTDLVGTYAAENLSEQISQPNRRATHERINPELIIRSTTGPCLS